MSGLSLFEFKMKMTLTGAFEVTDDEMVITGRAVVKSGIIEEFEFVDSKDESYPLQVLTALLRQVSIAADKTKSDLLIKIDSDMDVIRTFESFGFRQIKDGIFQRIAGSTVVPL